MEIPHILHQVWYQGEGKLSAKYRASRRRWQEMHPKWTYMFWDAAKMRNLVQTKYRWFLAIYDSYPELIQRCDAGRYFILDQFGGVYVDMDTEPLRPLDELVRGRSFITSPSLENKFELLIMRGGRFMLNNAIIASTPNHPCWQYVFREMVACHKRRWWMFMNMLFIEHTTGPRMYTNAIDKYITKEQKGDVYIADPDLMKVCRLDGKCTKESAPNAYVIHYGALSWNTGFERFLAHYAIYMEFILAIGLVVGIIVWAQR